MQNAIDAAKKALRGNPKSAQTTKGAKRLPVVFVNKAKTTTTVKAVYPCDFYTQNEAEKCMFDAYADTFYRGLTGVTKITEEFYWGLHCKAYIVRMVFNN